MHQAYLGIIASFNTLTHAGHLFILLSTWNLELWDTFGEAVGAIINQTHESIPWESRLR